MYCKISGKGSPFSTKIHEAEIGVAELEMLRFSLGVTRMDKIRNEYTRGTAQVGRFGEKTREARLRLCGHVGPTEEMSCVYWETDAEDGVARKEETGMPKRRFKDVVKVVLAEIDVTEEDTEGRNN